MMTPERAAELGLRVSETLLQSLKREQLSELFIVVGKTYLLALTPRLPEIETATTIRYAVGGIGLKGRQLYEWLRRDNQDHYSC
jgi:hypothetical protein